MEQQNVVTGHFHKGRPRVPVDLFITEVERQSRGVRVPPPRPLRVSGLIDTGRYQTSLSVGYLRHLGLHSGAAMPADQRFLVKMMFPMRDGAVQFPEVWVLAHVGDEEDNNCFLGVDVLSGFQVMLNWQQGTVWMQSNGFTR